jgi:hypothetical protein
VRVFLKKLGMHGHQNDWGMRSVVLDHLRQRQSLRFARRQLDIMPVRLSTRGVLNRPCVATS